MNIVMLLYPRLTQLDLNGLFEVRTRAAGLQEKCWMAARATAAQLRLAPSSNKNS